MYIYICIYVHIYIYMCVCVCVCVCVMYVSEFDVHERVSTKNFVVLIIGNSKSNHLGAQGTFNQVRLWIPPSDQVSLGGGGGWWRLGASSATARLWTPLGTERALEEGGSVEVRRQEMPQFSLYQILFYFKALWCESLILVLPLPTFKAYLIAVLLHGHCAIYAPHLPSPSVCHTPYNIRDGNILSRLSLSPVSGGVSSLRRDRQRMRLPGCA